MSKQPVCVFDSGIGGLTVVEHLVKVCPSEEIIYFGDTARVPYGIKSPHVVQEFSRQDTGFLLKFNPKLIVIACHTASSLAMDFLAERFPDVHFANVLEPSAEKALAVTSGGRIGVIGTPATVKSGKYQELLRSRNARVKVVAKACPLFVPLIEEGWRDHPVAREVAAIYLRELKESEIDTLILGCTHYPLLKDVIAGIMGRKVKLVDASEEVAQNVQAYLKGNRLLGRRKKPHVRLFFSDCNSHLRAAVSLFLGKRQASVEEVSVDGLT